MNILYLINSFDVGGAEKAMVRLVSRLNRDKFDINVISLKEGSGKLREDLKDPNVSVLTLAAKSKFDLSAITKFRKVISKYDPDILITSLFQATIFGRILGSLADIPVIISWEHNEELGGFLRRLLNIGTCFMSNIIIADSERVQAVLEEKLPSFCSSKLVTVPIGGVDLEKFKPKKSRKEKDEIIIGSVGSLEKQKGYLEFSSTMKHITERKKNVKFSLAGGGSLKKSLVTRVEKLGIGDAVNVLGYRDNIPDVLREWSIYVQPSRWEGLCITVVEAMAVGLPIVAYDVGGISESVDDGVNGFLVPPGEKEEFSEKVIELVENDQLRKSMGRKSRRIAKEKYSLDNMVKSFEKILKGAYEEEI